MNARNLLLLIVCGGWILLGAGCATPVKTDYKAGAVFSQYRTFALLPLPQKAPSDDPGLLLRVAEPAREAVVSAMLAKGFTEAPKGQSDLEINLRGQSLPQVAIRDYGYTYPVMTRYGTVMVTRNPYTSVSTYTERTLIIEMLDPKSKELVWVGWLKKDSSGKVQPKQLQKAIQDILAEFPPAPKKE